VAWYRASGRDLPWRRTRDPYAIWLSEIMLQQTRVETVLPYYERFLTRFPTVERLAEAPLEAVLTEWSGLGYYRRARMLHAAACAVVRDHDATFPRSAAGRRALPGVGRYTAGAVASIAWNERAALVDGNVARVLARLFALTDDPTRGPGHARAWAIAESLVPAEAPGDFNQALMELGATVCTPRVPECGACPIAGHCRALADGLERELPRIGRKTPPEDRRLAALVARAPDGVLLARRAEGGLFAGLWEPPSIELARPRVTHGASASNAASERVERGLFRALLGVEPRELRARGSIVHVLSHRRLEVLVLQGSLTALQASRAALTDVTTYDAVRVVGGGELARLPSSTLARRILAAVAEH
jgi:A/G-specific adenine glycosylase